MNYEEYAAPELLCARQVSPVPADLPNGSVGAYYRGKQDAYHQVVDLLLKMAGEAEEHYYYHTAQSFAYTATWFEAAENTYQALQDPSYQPSTQPEDDPLFNR